MNNKNVVFIITLNFLYFIFFVPFCIIVFFTTGSYGFLTGTLFYTCVITWLLSNIYIVKRRKNEVKISYFLFMNYINPVILILTIVTLMIYEKITFEYHPLLQEALSKKAELPNNVKINIEETDEFLKVMKDVNQYYFIVKDDITKEEAEFIYKWIPKDKKNYIITFHRESSVYHILFELRNDGKNKGLRCLDAGEVNDWCERLKLPYIK